MTACADCGHDNEPGAPFFAAVGNPMRTAAARSEDRNVVVDPERRRGTARAGGDSPGAPASPMPVGDPPRPVEPAT